MSVAVTDLNGTSQTLGTLVNAKMTRLLLTSDEPLDLHEYRYLRQESRPTAREWAAVKPALFFKDLFLYREPVNQWLQVTLKGGRVYCTGLLAGILDGPPDKPLTAKEWFEQAEHGGVVYAQKRLGEHIPQKLADQRFAYAKRAGYRVVRIHHANTDKLKVALVKTAMRHGMYAYMAGGTMESQLPPKELHMKYLDQWRKVMAYYKNMSYRLAYAMFIETANKHKKVRLYTGSTTNLSALYKDITPELRKIAPKRLFIYQPGSRNSAGELHKLPLPLHDGGKYEAVSFHSGWAMGKAWYTPEDKISVDKSILPAVQYSKKTGIPVVMDVFSIVRDQHMDIYPNRVRLAHYVKGLYTSTPTPILITRFAPFIMPSSKLYGVRESGKLSKEQVREYLRPVGPGLVAQFACAEVLNGEACARHDDPDGDFLPDAFEKAWGLDPNSPDTDGDDIFDPIELRYGLDPKNSEDGSPHDNQLISADADGDGLSNVLEINRGMDPFNHEDFYRDVDGDAMMSGLELITGYNPRARMTVPKKNRNDDDLMDADHDGVDNWEEWKLGLDPVVGDVDLDGVEQHLNPGDPKLRKTFRLDGKSVGNNSIDPLPFVPSQNHVVMHTFDMRVKTGKKGPYALKETDGKVIANYAPYGPRESAVMHGEARIGGENATQVRHQYSRALQIGKAGDHLAIPTKGLGLESSFSVSVKFKLTSPAKGKAQLLWGAWHEETGIACFVYSGKLYAGTWLTEGSVSNVLIGPISVGKWHHIALVFDRKTKQLTSYYRPDLKTLKKVHKAVAIPAVIGQLVVGNTPFKLIYERASIPMAPTVGMIDDVHVFVRTLSEADAGMLGHTFALDSKQVEVVRKRRAQEAAKAAKKKKKK
jgi:hypothetical protein